MTGDVIKQEILSEIIFCFVLLYCDYFILYWHVCTFKIFFFKKYFCLIVNKKKKNVRLKTFFMDIIEKS
jgi:hypothetical protein